MMGIRYWQSAGLCGLAMFSFGALAEDSVSKWAPHIDLEAKPGSKRSLGEADLFLPLSQDAGSLVFANLRGRFDNHSSNEGNLGFGMRRMLEDGWNFGVYGYLDRRRSETGNYFNQATLGAEALGVDWDFRANAYLPQGERVRTLSTSVTVGIPTAALVGNVIQVATPGNTTTTTTESSLKGYDAEVGWRLPFFNAEDRSQMRLYLGGYRFYDSVTTVSGPRLRAELAMSDLPQLWRGAELLLGAEAQQDNVRGSQNFLSVRLRVPLGGEQPRPGRLLSAQERRMTTPVMRDVDVVTNARTVTTTAPTIVETATATAGGQPVTVIDSATTSGAALQTALNAAGAASPNSMVILSGSFDTGNNTTITLSSGQTVMGRGTLTVSTASGRTATLVASTGATITSANAAAASSMAAIDMAANSTLTGMTLTPTTAASNAGVYAVRVSGVAGATITNNTITATSPNGSVFGVRVEGAGASNATVSGNTITATNSNVGGMAIGLYMTGTSLSLTNNTFSVSADTKYAVYKGVGAGTITGSGNTYLTSAGCSDNGAGMPCP